MPTLPRSSCSRANPDPVVSQDTRNTKPMNIDENKNDDDDDDDSTDKS